MFSLEIVINVLDDVGVFFSLCESELTHKVIVPVDVDVSAVMRPQTYQKLFYPHPHSAKLYTSKCQSVCMCARVCV